MENPKMWWYEEDFEYISWSWREFNEFLSAYSDTLYDKHKIETNSADERIEDEGYGMNNECQTGQIKVPRGQSSRYIEAKLRRIGMNLLI